MNHAMLTGDGKVLMEGAIPEETGCSQLSSEKAHKLWELLVRPYIESSRLVGEDPAIISSNRVQATAGYRFVDRTRTPWGISIVANQAEGGPKTNVLAQMFFVAAQFDESKRVVPLTDQGALITLRKFRPQLEKLGVPGMMLYPGRCLDWDALDTLLQNRAGFDKS